MKLIFMLISFLIRLEVSVSVLRGMGSVENLYRLETEMWYIWKSWETDQREYLICFVSF